MYINVFISYNYFDENLINDIIHYENRILEKIVCDTK
jgi:hypothetical protein